MPSTFRRRWSPPDASGPAGTIPTRWQVAPAESAELSPPYALVTAGESLHWMDWPVVLPRFRDALSQGGVLAIAGREHLPAPWSDGLLTIIKRHTTNRDFQPYNLVDELTNRDLFTVLGSTTTANHAYSVDCRLHRVMALAQWPLARPDVA